MKINGLRKVMVTYEWNDGTVETIEAEKRDGWHDGIEVEYDVWTDPPREYNDHGFRAYVASEDGTFLDMKIKGSRLSTTRTRIESEPLPESDTPQTDQRKVAA